MKRHKFKPGDRVFYRDDSSWRGVVRELEDLDEDGHLTLVIDWYTLSGRPCDSSTDAMEFEDVEHVSCLPIVERLAELGRELPNARRRV